MTANLQMQGDTNFILVDKLNLGSIAKRKNLSKIICEYLLYVDNNPRKALELILLVEENWWWKAK
jgi:hypothetical protein